MIDTSKEEILSTLNFVLPLDSKFTYSLSTLIGTWEALNHFKVIKKYLTLIEKYDLYEINEYIQNKQEKDIRYITQEEANFIIRKSNITHSKIYLEDISDYLKKYPIPRYQNDIKFRQLLDVLKEAHIIREICNLNEKQKSLGVIASPEGDHAKDVARVCKKLKIDCSIIVSKKAEKSNTVKELKKMGAQLILFGENKSQALKKAVEISKKRKSILINPYELKKINGIKCIDRNDIISLLKEEHSYRRLKDLSFPTSNVRFLGFSHLVAENQRQ